MGQKNDWFSNMVFVGVVVLLKTVIFFHHESPVNLYISPKIGRGFTRPTEVIKVQVPRATTKSLVPTDGHGLVYLNVG